MASRKDRLVDPVVLLLYYIYFYIAVGIINMKNIIHSNLLRPDICLHVPSTYRLHFIFQREFYARRYDRAQHLSTNNGRQCSNDGRGDAR